MAAHACLKNEVMEDEKCHNLMSLLKWERNTNAKEDSKYKTAQAESQENCCFPVDGQQSKHQVKNKQKVDEQGQLE